MKFNARQYSLASFSVLIALSGTAHSATTYMEARNDAMGGTGVASSHYGTAALANPALLTHFGASDDFSLILPSVGAQVAGLSPSRMTIKQVQLLLSGLPILLPAVGKSMFTNPLSDIVPLATGHLIL